MLVAWICGRRFGCKTRNRTRVRLGYCFRARQPNPRRPSVDNAREGKRTLARKHGHLRVLLLSASESGRGFGSVFHHQHSKSQPLSVGIFFARFPSENRNGVARVASAPLTTVLKDSSRSRPMGLGACLEFHPPFKLIEETPFFMAQRVPSCCRLGAMTTLLLVLARTAEETNFSCYRSMRPKASK